MLTKLRRKVRLAFIEKNSRKVDFVIAGTQKGGTTALDAYLRMHPDLCLAQRKEVHFFDTEHYFQQKIDYSAYHLWFNPVSTYQLLGEATPIYMYWHSCPERMWEYHPKIKIIMILRNPIERAYSHWNMMRDLGRESLSFWDAIQIEPQRQQKALPFQLRDFSYVNRGLYVEQLQRIWRYFPKNQMFVTKTENLKQFPLETLNHICRFLGVKEFKDIPSKDVHSVPYVSKITREEKAYLQNIFTEEIRNLERIMEWDCSNWLVG